VPNPDPIEHVIVLMLENRSFDHMLGGLAAAIPDLDGIPAGASPRINNDHDGNPYDQVLGASRALRYDPRHELEHVLGQLRGNNAGFVDDFSRAYPLSAQQDRAEIMKYHEDGSLPALHALAKSFAVCDKWFSSLPGPTWPNRFFVHSGTSLGRVSMPEGILDANLHWYDQTTLYDRLKEAGKTWKIYYGDIPQSLMLVHQLEPENARNYFKIQRFFADVAGDPKQFPHYSFIEPPYYQPGAADDHPPHDVLEGERLIGDVYNAIRRHEELWKSSLLVVLYDEHGGFYDHVVPPKADPPDHHVEEYSFTQLGVRVPAILVSPFVKHDVIHVEFDHTSLLRYLSDKWDLGPLGARVAAANSIAPTIAAEIQAAGPMTIPSPTASGITPPNYGQLQSRIQPVLSGHQSALLAMTQLLESMTDVGADDIVGRGKRLITGFDGAVDVGIERVEQFLDQQRRA